VDRGEVGEVRAVREGVGAVAVDLLDAAVRSGSDQVAAAQAVAADLLRGDPPVVRPWQVAASADIALACDDVKYSRGMGGRVCSREVLSRTWL